MIRWIEDLGRLPPNQVMVLVTIVQVRGSAPREIGARMIVTPQQTLGSIGGGQLEYQCQVLANGFLETLEHDNTGSNTRCVRTFPLGANCGQCCGGVVDVLFELLPHAPRWLNDSLCLYDQNIPGVLATKLTDGSAFEKTLYRQGQAAVDPLTVRCRALLQRQGSAEVVRIKIAGGSAIRYLLEAITPLRHQLVIFGAGHVGRAVVEVFAKLECQIQWIDSRRELFPTDGYSNVTQIVADPQRQVPALPAGAMCLVMTHSHALDFELCTQILQRDDYRYCGLIGSVSKRKRFERLMRQLGIPLEMVDRLTCPVGVNGIGGKRPAEIAISIAAQLLPLMSSDVVPQVRPTTHLKSVHAAVPH